MRLKDKVAIITGGSRGIGYATADKFLKEGATVILTASSQGSADKAVAQLKEKYPDATVAGISPNLSNLESVRNAFREAASKYGCIDILVNNAGISESTPFTEYTEETFDKVMDLNVKGVFNATRAASECMIAKGQGVILSTSSMVSIYGQPSGFAYPASKFAVNGLTVSLARELGPKGIRVNAVAPGITLTDMMKAVPKEIIEPLRNLFKDEVRKVGLELGIPEHLVFRQPFPGPGLGIRIIGEVTAEKVKIVQDADAIYREEIANAGLDREINQYFAALTNMRSVGVMGDERTYDYAIALRAVKTIDFMTAESAEIPYEVLQKVTSRIINEVSHVNRVMYDITSKPPGTIEFE